MVRTEQRRHTREQEAHAMQQLLHDPGPNLDWETLRPVLDTANALFLNLTFRLRLRRAVTHCACT